VPAFWAGADLAGGRSACSLTEGPAAAAARRRHRRARRHAGRRRPPRGPLTRRLRDALHAVLARLQFGQVLLSVGATAPFIGLFGTVWGIYHALLGISAAGAVHRQGGRPGGRGLIMTAAGLAVAIPAVLAYNVFRNRGGPARPS
jgi:biopolymer transport protein ExbB